MQVFWPADANGLAAFRATVSEARFSTYLAAAGGEPVKAMALYHWNCKLSEAMYLPLQMWEISLRNKLNIFLIWKYKTSWPYEQRFLRDASKPEVLRLNNTKNRLSPRHLAGQLSTDQIVADLSAGFWVSLLTRSYDIPFAWKFNLPRVFPNLAKPDRKTIALQCAALLSLRNRVAHHEPIFHLALPALYQDVLDLTGGMCASASSYLQGTSNFIQIWNDRR